MEGSGRKEEILKPIILKVGIPIALSVVGFTCAIISARKKVPSQETQVNSAGTNSGEELGNQESIYGQLESTYLHCEAEDKEEEEEMDLTDTQIMKKLESLRIRDGPDLEEEILGLRSQVGVLQEQEQELERRFLNYCDIKEQELALMELKNMLLLETVHDELLGLGVEFVEAETKRLEAVLVEYLRVIEQLKCTKLKNGLLQKKVKKLWKRMRKHTQVLRRQGLLIRAKDAEILRSHEELERRDHVIKELESEIITFRTLVDQLQEERKEFVQKLELAESSALSISQTKAEAAAIMEENSRLLTELEELRKERKAELEELIGLRWSNACLRYELTRYQEQKNDQEEKKSQMPEKKSQKPQKNDQEEEKSQMLQKNDQEEKKSQKPQRNDQEEEKSQMLQKNDQEEKKSQMLQKNDQEEKKSQKPQKNGQEEKKSQMPQKNDQEEEKSQMLQKNDQEEKKSQMPEKNDQEEKKSQMPQKNDQEEEKSQMPAALEGNEERGDGGLEYDSDGLLAASGNGEASMGITTTRHAYSKRRRLLDKLRKWVEGSEKSTSSRDAREKEKRQNMCMGIGSASAGEVERLPSRKSRSSA